MPAVAGVHRIGEETVMKRKSWISWVCAGLLLIALAIPSASAAADGGDAPRFALLERVLSWIECWAPAGAPGAGLERETLADTRDDGPTTGAAAPSCEPCNHQGEMDGTIDPDG